MIQAYKPVQIVCIENKELKRYGRTKQLQLSIAATRARVPNEITPSKAENSASKDNHIAARAIDMSLGTWSRTEAGTDGRHWLKITLANVECVKQVIWYDRNGNSRATWTCTRDDCSDCVGRDCSIPIIITVSNEGAASDPSLVSNCKYGDTVKMENGGPFGVFEIAIVRKPG